MRDVFGRGERAGEPVTTSRPEPRIGGDSPWGAIQSCTRLADGVICVDTASHGGIWLSSERLAQMPAEQRSTDGWYEEDCEVAFPLRRFFDEVRFTDAHARDAAQAIIDVILDHTGGAFSAVAMNR